jgi:hypothetical protein
MGADLRLDASKALRIGAEGPRVLGRAIARFLPEAGSYAAGIMRRVIASRTRGYAKGQTAGSVRATMRGAAVVVGPQPRTTKWGTFDPVFLDEGTRPHELRPRFARVLAFASSGAQQGTRAGRQVSVFRFGGRTVVSDLVYARSVHHPGTKGIHFVDATLQEIRTPLQLMLDRAIQAEAAKLPGGK